MFTGKVSLFKNVIALWKRAGFRSESAVDQQDRVYIHHEGCVSDIAETARVRI